ncbi:hypothetical protein MTBBW1_1150012 [Desulfamplus magnetovallimortis]|uniref:Integrase family protein n=1 Tax=Desulfamplus magnetovallimortis TaxID=1246637 RepID=A0A1W1H5T2_9BACT|nr:site-specific integrase [Desulfamplus magnetovallimortis]SLM27839.1 hypothetical protein MTBBW1_1150012 [Desulfamplus magnetovallimortis]
MATIYKRGKFWWVAYKDRNGRRIQESTKLGDKAAAMCIKKHYDAVEKSYALTGTPLQRAIKFSDCFNEYINLRKLRRAHKTITNDKLAFKSFSDFMGNRDIFINEVSKDQIERWYNYLLKEKAAATANCRLRHLNTFFNTALKKQYIVTSPCCNIAKTRDNISKIRTLTREEVQTLLECMPETWQDLTKLALYTGVRASEVCRLEKKDIDFDLQAITVTSTPDNPTKSRKFRNVPLPAASIVFFQSLLKKYDGKMLLLNNKGNPWKKDWVAHGFKKYSVLSGVNCVFHDLRRTYGAWLIINGCDLVTVQENLGHSDITVTRNHYIHLMMDYKKSQVDKLPEI